MSWYFVILLTQMHAGLHEGFLWYDPTFSSKEECIQWVNNNPVVIFQALNSEFVNWEIKETFCIREDRLPDFNMQPRIEGVET